MALIAARAPTQQDLRWFGFILLLLFGMIGGIVLWRSESWVAAGVLWSVGGVGAAAYYAVKPLRPPMYRGFMKAVAPIGWTISHLLLAVVFYLMITPIGAVLRLVGKDTMLRRWDTGAASYWARRPAPKDNQRYLRQY